MAATQCNAVLTGTEGEGGDGRFNKDFGARWSMVSAALVLSVPLA